VGCGPPRPLAIGAPGTSLAGSEAGPGPGTTPAGVVLNLAQPLSIRPNSRPLSSSEGGQGWGVPQGVVPSRVPARRAALLAPSAALLGPSAPALTLNMASIPPIRCWPSSSLCRTPPRPTTTPGASSRSTSQYPTPWRAQSASHSASVFRASSSVRMGEGLYQFVSGSEWRENSASRSLSRMRRSSSRSVVVRSKS
jgi:hypothetical protein